MVREECNLVFDDPTIANQHQEYKKQNMKWIIVGDQNYGEGSSREHAAMTQDTLDVQQSFLEVLLEYMKLILRNKEC